MKNNPNPSIQLSNGPSISLLPSISSPSFLSSSFPWDALSTTATQPVSSLLPKSFTSTNLSTPLHPFKPPPHPHPPHLSTTLSNKANRSLKPLSTPLPTFIPTLPPYPTPQTHHQAVTGYAAALLDAACCDGALGVVAKDARRVRRVVHVVLGDERVEEGKKGEVVTRVVEGGGFYAKLVVLVRKGKVGVVGEVMEEFGRLWEELCGVSEGGCCVRELKRVRDSYPQGLQC